MRLIQHILRRVPWTSYAQCGEDLLARYFLCDMLGIAKPSYLDLGAHDPTWLSNTYLFYRRGCRGVCVEPNPHSCRAIKRTRPKDICLTCGVGVTASTSAPFFVMDPPTLSSFSKAFIDANLANPLYRLKETVSTPLLTTSEIIARHFPTPPNFVSVDLEGLDEQIILAWDFEKYRPELFCVETVAHHDRSKVDTITEAFTRAGYRVFADTYINTLYVEGHAWDRWQSRA